MVDPMSNQMMGYDRAITMFSPDGRLLQVEYAKKMVKQGTTAIGMICTDGIVLVVDRRIVDNLIVLKSLEKIMQIDDHIGATVSGSLSDGRVLIERSQVKAQQHRVTYDTPIETLTIVKDICDLKQICTQSGGLRPFGVSVMIAGIDEDGPSLYVTEPSGIYFQYKATAIGEGEIDAEELLHKHYKEGMSVEEGLKLGVSVLAKVIGKDLTADRIDCAFIKTDDPVFHKVDREKIDKMLKEMKKKK
ncbi:archaeal proteasome endopeptidase complex subunit alpha [Candidatus Woesearchaeota archaeon]|nr:archaeal proteasome endopeptidase complex subunit alpha [Candidatus Woesearchaeota archaeon]